MEGGAVEYGSMLVGRAAERRGRTRVRTDVYVRGGAESDSGATATDEDVTQMVSAPV